MDVAMILSPLASGIEKTQVWTSRHMASSNVRPKGFVAPDRLCHEV